MTLNITLDSKHPEWHSEPQAQWIPDERKWEIPTTAPAPSRPPEEEVLRCLGMDMTRLDQYEVGYHHETRQRVCKMRVRGVTQEEYDRLGKIKGLVISIV